MSAALSRLRRIFGDPLFLRSADGLLPTPRTRAGRTALAGPATDRIHARKEA